MSNLQIESLKTNGVIKFDMMDGSFINIDIIECQQNSVLEFTWDKDRVRFEIHKEENGTLLLLKEYIHVLTDHTPKDIAGWHICLELFSAVLEGEEKNFLKINGNNGLKYIKIRFLRFLNYKVLRFLN